MTRKGKELAPGFHRLGSVAREVEDARERAERVEEPRLSELGRNPLIEDSVFRKKSWSR